MEEEKNCEISQVQRDNLENLLRNAIRLKSEKNSSYSFQKDKIDNGTDYRK